MNRVFVVVAKNTNTVMGNNIPQIITDVSFDFRWDSKKVWQLNIPTIDLEIDKLLWHFDIPFWERSGTDDYNLTPWEVIKNAPGTEEHRQKIILANTLYPIDIMENKARLLILDGLHRLVKLYEAGEKVVKVRVVPREYIPHISK